MRVSTARAYTASRVNKQNYHQTLALARRLGHKCLEKRANASVYATGTSIKLNFRHSRVGRNPISLTYHDLMKTWIPAYAHKR